MSCRVVHRHKTLKDEDLVPDDAVDNGEQAEVEEVLTGEGLDLSYLWVVDANNLEPQSRRSTSNAEGSASTAANKLTTSATDAQVCPHTRLVITVSTMPTQHL